MYNRFNFYDLVGYVIPGTVFLLSIYWLNAAFIALPLNLGVSGITVSVLLLMLSYVVGHLVQNVGVKLEQVLGYSARHSDRLLQSDDRSLSADFKENLWKEVHKHFRIRLTNNDDEKIRKRKHDEVFKLCYSMIIQENAANHVEIFSGLHSLCRGLATAVLSVAIVALLVALRGAYLLFIYWDDATRFAMEARIFGVALAAVPIGIWVMVSLFRRGHRFSFNFVASVYRNFYTFTKRNVLEGRKLGIVIKQR